MTPWTEALRNGNWLTAERMRLVALAVLAASGLGLVYLVAAGSGHLTGALLDPWGRPVGTDFSSFYSAGSLALDGHPAAAYDPIRHYARQQAIFGAETPYYSWLYPPFFLLLMTPLALLPYPLALLAWQGSTLLIYLLSVRAILVSAAPDPKAVTANALWLLLAAAAPAVFINIGHGQNAFLTAALFGGALAMLDRRPILAGILFGLLIYKPQFGLMIPIALAASGRWRVAIAAAATIAALVPVTIAAFGIEVWPAFITSAGIARKLLLESDTLGWHKVQSILAWTRLWGGSQSFGYALQAAMTTAAAIATLVLWRSPARLALKAAGLMLASFLAAMHSHDYDFVMLTPLLAFLAADGLRYGFPPWQKTLLAALWLMPLIARSVAGSLLIPLGAPLLLLALMMVLRQSAAAPALSLSPRARAG